MTTATIPPVKKAKLFLYDLQLNLNQILQHLSQTKLRAILIGSFSMTAALCITKLIFRTSNITAIFLGMITGLLIYRMMATKYGKLAYSTASAI